MKRKLTLIIGTLAVTGIVAWAQHAIAQSESIEVEAGPFAAFFDEFPDEDDQPGRRGFQGPHGGMKGGFPSDLVEKLELTDAQQTKLKSLRTAHAKEMAKLRADLEVARIELREVMTGTNPSAAEAKSKAAEVNAARAILFEKSVAFRVEAKNVLTPEQQKTLREEGGKMHRGRRFGAMRGPRGGRGFGYRSMGMQPETTPER